MNNSEAKITLAVDAMGSDRGPSEVVAGVSMAVDTSPRGTKFLLFGKEEILINEISKFDNLNGDQVEIRHASEVVEMDEKPIAGIKAREIHPWHAGYSKSVKDQEAQALLSCGNTGCLMAGSTIRLRTLEIGASSFVYNLAWQRKILYSFGRWGKSSR